jgi:hypothetical protein
LIGGEERSANDIQVTSLLGYNTPLAITRLGIIQLPFSLDLKAIFAITLLRDWCPVVRGDK